MSDQSETKSDCPKCSFKLHRLQKENFNEKQMLRCHQCGIKFYEGAEAVQNDQGRAAISFYLEDAETGEIYIIKEIPFVALG